jgi:RNA polymerase primary sigma factor
MRALSITPSITTRDDESLNRYFNDIKKIGLISAKEELKLVPKIRQGESAALSLLVTSNLRFVVSVAKQYQNRGVSISDLINEGNVGLITAAKRFDESRGCKFISYAVWWIRQSIMNAVIEQSRTVHLPYNFTSMLGKFNKAFACLEQKLSRKPTVEEVAELLDLDPAKMEELLAFSGREVSLDKPLGGEVEGTLLDVLATTDYAGDPDQLKDSRKRAIGRSFAVLDQRDRKILTMYFGLNLSSPVHIEEIAQGLALSTEHVRRLKDHALDKLRKSSHSALLKSCIE